MKYWKGLILILILAEICVSIFSVYESYTGFTACFSGFNCKTVQSSAYASIGGIKLSWIGLIAFSVLLITFILAYKRNISYKLFWLGTIIGCIGAIYLISIQTFVLKTFCSSCLAIDALMIIIGIATLTDFIKESKQVH